MMDEKVVITVIFSKGHAFNWWTSKNKQNPEVVASLIWVGFKEFLVKGFTPDRQELREGINMVKMMQTRPLKANVCALNTQMSDTLKMDELFKKCIVLDGV